MEYCPTFTINLSWICCQQKTYNLPSLTASLPLKIDENRPFCPHKERIVFLHHPFSDAVAVSSRGVIPCEDSNPSFDRIHSSFIQSDCEDLLRYGMHSVLLEVCYPTPQ